ncbi:MAG: hypothetical protein Q7K21_04605, partial [Elusimicrobiota bacterium]|nr:hypothetical protein [Elusimicrobiota bacterium]
MKKSVKIGLWVVGVLILALVIIIGPEYKFVKTYPAACWTDDGKQIVYLEHRELRRPMKLKIWGDADDILKSKTYLCIMDANGKNKRVVGVVPDLTDKQKDLMRGGRLPEKEFKE